MLNNSQMNGPLGFFNVWQENCSEQCLPNSSLYSTSGCFIQLSSILLKFGRIGTVIMWKRHSDSAPSISAACYIAILCRALLPFRRVSINNNCIYYASSICRSFLSRSQSTWPIISSRALLSRAISNLPELSVQPGVTSRVARVTIFSRKAIQRRSRNARRDWPRAIQSSDRNAPEILWMPAFPQSKFCRSSEKPFALW